MTNLKLFHPKKSVEFDTRNETLEEEWKVIDEYPNYMISNKGEVQNVSTGRLMQLSTNNFGTLRVTVRNSTGIVTKSVRVLVAKAFVDGETEIFNSVINLDGNEENCRADNLAWRPHWFSLRFKRQFGYEFPMSYYTTRIRNVESGAEYTNTFQCSRTEGVLFVDVWSSIYRKTKVFPSMCTYVIV